MFLFIFFLLIITYIIYSIDLKYNSHLMKYISIISKVQAILHYICIYYITFGAYEYHDKTCVVLSVVIF